MIKLHARRSESVFGSPTRSLALLVCSRAAEAALGVLKLVGSPRCAQTQVSAVRIGSIELINSFVDPLQLDPKMFSAPADAAVGFSQLPRGYTEAFNAAPCTQHLASGPCRLPCMRCHSISRPLPVPHVPDCPKVGDMLAQGTLRLCQCRARGQPLKLS
jgi:hypothetical protein